MKAKPKKLSADKLRTISEEIVRIVSAPYRKRIAELERENERLRKNAKKVIDGELKKEVEYLKCRNDMAWGHFDSDKEKSLYDAFCKRHRHMKQFKGQERCAITVAKPPYVIEEATSVGTIKRVVCPICGKEKNITDIDAW